MMNIFLSHVSHHPASCFFAPFFAVAVKILFLRDPEPQHHWCIPFAVDGNPVPTIRWLHNGKPLTESRYTYTQLIPDSEDGSILHGCLFLNKPTHMNNGYYTLIVNNTLGTDNATAIGMFMDNPFGPTDPEGKILGENNALKKDIKIIKFQTE